MFTSFDAAAVSIVLAAIFGYLNHRTFRLPQPVALTVMGCAAALTVAAVDRFVPHIHMRAGVVRFISTVDFRSTLMDGMLCFLLFAGALNVNIHEMRKSRWAIIVLSTVGVAISTALIGGAFYVVAGIFGLAVPLIWCFVFGALISPTDPVAVMEVMRRAELPPALEATVAGESLFNDGVGIVIFALILASAMGTQSFSTVRAAALFLQAGGGGLLLGLALGWLAYRAIATIDDYRVEVMISLAVVMGGYSIANRLHVSGPVAMAVAGVLIGSRDVAEVMSQTSRDYLLKFWDLIDEILNAVLFLLIGVAIIVIPHNFAVLWAGVAAIPVALAGRAVSVAVPLLVMRPFTRLGHPAGTVLIWGGMRGGVSIALALGLPDSQYRSAILTAAYVIVLFSVLVQGSTIERVVGRRAGPASP
ncbi:MAG: sodium:proton antiporter [Herbaspirillum sp.]|jgi:CPA1 family monovalent cation:H+ antiporter|nr:sodium:proton antiporter [Herbaspirillum sp.]